MRLILHIGMGKTGTSSIQKALEASQDKLAETGCHYLGMWLDEPGEPFAGFQGLPKLFASSPEQQKALASSFVARMHAKEKEEGYNTFVFSNEALFEQAERIIPFVNVLRQETDLCILAYLRDPHEWLPSAFAQWGIRHKTKCGPLQPFGEAGRSLILQYEALRSWFRYFGDSLFVRRHEKSLDVVSDMAEFCGLDLVGSSARHLERSEPAELLMRAAFNARFSQQVLPDRFNRVVFPTGQKIQSLRELADLCFQNDEIDEIVEEQRDLFEFIAAEFGPDFNFLEKQYRPAKVPDHSELQQRMLDYLVEMTLQQAARIKQLEKRIAALEEDQ